MYAPGLQVMKMFVCGYGLLTFSCIFHLTHLAQYKDDGVGVPGCEKFGQGQNSHPPPPARARACTRARARAGARATISHAHTRSHATL